MVPVVPAGRQGLLGVEALHGVLVVPMLRVIAAAVDAAYSEHACGGVPGRCVVSRDERHAMGDGAQSGILARAPAC